MQASNKLVAAGDPFNFPCRPGAEKAQRRCNTKLQRCTNTVVIAHARNNIPTTLTYPEPRPEECEGLKQ
jgi:hypothetical protein